MKPTIPDGQHRHGQGKEAMIRMGEDGLRLVAKHIPRCPNAPVIVDKDTKIPLQFVIEEDGKTSIVCGYCKQNLGACFFEEQK